MSEIPLVGRDVDVGERVVVRGEDTARSSPSSEPGVAWFEAERSDLLAFLR